MTTYEAICIGDELLDGRTRDGNGAFLGEWLTLARARLERITIIADDIDVICAALEAATSDVIVVSGGLGPTQDDMTRDAAARWCGEPLEFDDASFDRIAARFAERGREVTPNNRRQALFPRGAAVLSTDVGTAPGFRVTHAGKTAYFFPGVAREFRWFVHEHLALPAAANVERRTLQFHGLGESALETEIADAADAARGRGVVVGYRASFPIIEVKIAGPAAEVAALEDVVRQRLQRWFVGSGDEPLPVRVGRLLLERGETVATAESCTAGGIAALITEVSGSSAWFGRGWVTYSNDAKVDELGVLPETLLAHGAVSAETVCEMAAGARERARATYALAVSGVAGPTGGSEEKPVGTVHFGLATPHGIYHHRVWYRGLDRAGVRTGTAYTALAMLLWALEDRLGGAGVAEHRTAPLGDRA